MRKRAHILSEQKRIKNELATSATQCSMCSAVQCIAYVHKSGSISFCMWSMLLLSLQLLLLRLLLFWCLLLTKIVAMSLYALRVRHSVRYSLILEWRITFIYSIHTVYVWWKAVWKKQPRLNNKWKIHAGGWRHKSNLLLLKRFSFVVLVSVSMKIVIVNFMQFLLCTQP